MPMLLCLKKERYKVGVLSFNCMTNDHTCIGLKQHKFISSQTYPSMSEYSAQGLPKLKSKLQPGLLFSSGLAVLSPAPWLLPKFISSSLHTSNSTAIHLMLQLSLTSPSAPGVERSPPLRAHTVH